MFQSDNLTWYKGRMNYNILKFIYKILSYEQFVNWNILFDLIRATLIFGGTPSIYVGDKAIISFGSLVSV